MAYWAGGHHFPVSWHTKVKSRLDFKLTFNLAFVSPPLSVPSGWEGGHSHLFHPFHLRLSALLSPLGCHFLSKNDCLPVPSEAIVQGWLFGGDLGGTFWNVLGPFHFFLSPGQVRNRSSEEPWQDGLPGCLPADPFGKGCRECVCRLTAAPSLCCARCYIFFSPFRYLGVCPTDTFSP